MMLSRKFSIFAIITIGSIATIYALSAYLSPRPLDDEDSYDDRQSRFNEGSQEYGPIDLTIKQKKRRVRALEARDTEEINELELKVLQLFGELYPDNSLNRQSDPGMYLPEVPSLRERGLGPISIDLDHAYMLGMPVTDGEIDFAVTREWASRSTVRGPSPSEDRPFREVERSSSSRDSVGVAFITAQDLEPTQRGGKLSSGRARALVASFPRWPVAKGLYPYAPARHGGSFLRGNTPRENVNPSRFPVWLNKAFPYDVSIKSANWAQGTSDGGLWIVKKYHPPCDHDLLDDLNIFSDFSHYPRLITAQDLRVNVRFPIQDPLSVTVLPVPSIKGVDVYEGHLYHPMHDNKGFYTKATFNDIILLDRTVDIKKWGPLFVRWKPVKPDTPWYRAGILVYAGDGGDPNAVRQVVGLNRVVPGDGEETRQHASMPHQRGGEWAMTPYNAETHARV